MLLPPLRERMELLHSLLPQGPDRWESLSKGQVRPRKTVCHPLKVIMCTPILEDTLGAV